LQCIHAFELSEVVGYKGQSGQSFTAGKVTAALPSVGQPDRWGRRRYVRP
jgi:hypothetical protein